MAGGILGNLHDTCVRSGAYGNYVLGCPQQIIMCDIAGAHMLTAHSPHWQEASCTIATWAATLRDRSAGAAAVLQQSLQLIQ